MINPKELRKQCAECPQATVFIEEQRGKCQTCPIYKPLNTLCTVCRQIGGVVSFNVSRRGKARRIDACPVCIELLT